MQDKMAMKIVEYDEVDPAAVLHVTMMALNFALTPEHAGHIRRTDPRPFPFFGVCAVEGQQVTGFVGVFRVPLITRAGREDMGGVWAVSTHPEYTRRGVASALLEEAHNRMRREGLRFSTLGTNTYRGAYGLYERLGYKDIGVWATALADWETAHQPTRLRAQPACSAGYDFVEDLFDRVAAGYLGFSWRHRPFAPLRDKYGLEQVWIIRENDQPVGYALVQADKALLRITNLLLKQDSQIVEAVSAVASKTKSAFVQVQLSRPEEVAALRGAGYRVAHPDWGAFMVKSLDPALTPEDARHLLAAGTDDFLISWLDTT